MRRLNNVHYEGWYRCGRCGNEYPMSKLQWQNLIGSLRCQGSGTRNCYDKPTGVLYSQRIDQIARILAQVGRFGEPEMEPKLATPPNTMGSGA